MQPATGIWWFFWMACVVSLTVPLLRQGRTDGWRALLGWRPVSGDWQMLKFGLPLFLLLYVLAFSLGLDLAGGLWAFLSAFGLYWLLAVLGFSPWLRGVLLLVVGFAWFLPLAAGSDFTSPLSYLFGLSAGRLLGRHRLTEGLEDYLLPAAGLIALYWISVSSPAAQLPVHQSILLIVLAISMLLRMVGDWPLLSAKGFLLRIPFLVLLAGLGGWLALQSWLLQPELLGWAALYAGGVLLGGLLLVLSPAEEPRPLSASLSALILIGLAALVASRLFGTLGWLVLAAGLLVFPQTRAAVVAATLYFLVRGLLQGFILQYNPNVTGINITHPYAGAALYVGFIALLLAPILLNSRWLAGEPDRISGTVPWGLLLTGTVLAGGLSNYFLHAEATGSLLVAATVAGLGVSLLSPLKDSLVPMPLLMSGLLVQAALLTAPLIAAGNEAERGQRMLVLVVALLVFLLLAVLFQKSASGGKPVEVA